MGVLAVQQRLPRKYTEEEASFLVTLATQLAGSLSSAEIRHKLQWLDWDTVAGNVTLDGVASARGVGIGTAVLVDLTLDLEAVPDREVVDVEAEVEQLREALAVLESAAAVRLRLSHALQARGLADTALPQQGSG